MNEQDRILESMLEKALELKVPCSIKCDERGVAVLDMKNKDQRKIYEMFKNYERNYRLNHGVTRA